MKGLGPLACVGAVVIILVSGCGGGGSSSSPETTSTDNPSSNSPDQSETVTPGAIIDSADKALVSQAVDIYKAFLSLRSVVFFGDSLSNGGRVVCLSGGVTQNMVGQTNPTEIPVEGSVSLAFSDCKVSEQLTLNNNARFEWTSYHHDENGDPTLNSALGTMDRLELKTSDELARLLGPLVVSYSLHEGRTVKSSGSYNDELFQLTLTANDWNVKGYRLDEEILPSGEVHLNTLQGEFTDRGVGAAYMKLETTETLVLMPGEPYPRVGELVFSTFENSLTVKIDSHETVTLTIDNGVDGSVDATHVYSWTDFLEF